MNARFYISFLGMLIATPLSAQSPAFLEGSQVIASPTMLEDRWERCTVNRYIPASDGYDLSCGTAKYVVPALYVLDATEENAILLIPPVSRDLLPTGTEVLASPAYLPDRWERCLVVRPLYETNGYELNCNSVVYIVSRTQVLPATEENLQSYLTDATKKPAVFDEQDFVGEATLPAPRGASNRDNGAADTPIGALPEAPDSFYPGMMIEASPFEGVWGGAVVIEQVEGGFRVQMLPGLGYVGAPQLVLQAEQMRLQIESNAPLPTAEQLTEPDASTNDFFAEQQLLEPDPWTAPDALLAAQTLPNGVYYCGKSTDGMVFFMGEIELQDSFYRGPAFDEQFGDWYPVDVTPEGTLNWRGPLGGFESDTSRVVSTQIKSDGGRPAFDVLLQMASGNFMSISCVPK